MNSFDQTIRLQDVEQAAFSGIDERAIIARAQNHTATRAQFRQECRHGCYGSTQIRAQRTAGSGQGETARLLAARYDLPASRVQFSRA